MNITIVKPGFEILTSEQAFTEIMPLLERAGRTCYKSEDKIKDDSADAFIRGIIRSGHESVIEHASITVKVVCSRSCSHQLVRHRIAAYSQESQRYCDYGKKGLQVICPPSIATPALGTWKYTYHQMDSSLWSHESGITHEPAQFYGWLNQVRECYERYLRLRQDGVPPEDARSVLPNATKTEVVTTFNLRQWRHVFRERALNKHAQWEIREIMMGILKVFTEKLPVIFEDLKND